MWNMQGEIICRKGLTSPVVETFVASNPPPTPATPAGCVSCALILKQTSNAYDAQLPPYYTFKCSCGNSAGYQSTSYGDVYGRCLNTPGATFSNVNGTLQCKK